MLVDAVTTDRPSLVTRRAPLAKQISNTPARNPPCIRPMVFAHVGLTVTRNVGVSPRRSENGPIRSANGLNETGSNGVSLIEASLRAEVV